MTGCRDAGSLDDVLQSIRDPMHRPAVPPRHQLALGRGSFGQSYFRRHPDKAVQFAVMCSDAVEQPACHLHWRHFVPAVEPIELGDHQKGRIHDCGLAALVQVGRLARIGSRRQQAAHRAVTHLEL